MIRSLEFPGQVQEDRDAASEQDTAVSQQSEMEAPCLFSLPRILYLC